ncbi:hypothetical protein [Thermococcus sp. 21S7]|uniref:cell wall-binding repeat-containing protein n=1 Tax=Thermococcus sp. 21S7 TaxID=1638221 RepID=UPI00143B8A89|nr:hypothetical protein [Thermococcus sp. 21S7]NJE61343.1 hypothetical protein [Thermococcus sp. 21S7]
MVWKKGIALLFGFMLLTTTLSFERVAADGTQVTVVLVSDNEADCALAEYLANVTGAIVVTTPWGVYNSNVTAEVMSYAPDEVIIIGGPDAVVEQYADDLQDLGIEVERWGGQNRYETNLMVMEQAKVKLKLKFNNSVIMVPGNDRAAIRAALRIAVRRKAMIAFVNDTSNVSRLMLKLQVRGANLTLVETPLMNGTMLRIREQLRECNCTSTEVNITAETALEAIKTAEKKLSLAEEMASNITPSTGDLVGGRFTVVSRFLMMSEMELENAEDAYNRGDYGRAYGQAMAAKAHAEFVIRIASEEWSAEMKKNTLMRAEMYVHRVERQLWVMERAGLNTTELRAMLERLKAAIRDGDQDAIQTLMEQIRERLMNEYLHGRLHIKERMNPPGHGGHSGP